MIKPKDRSVRVHPRLSKSPALPVPTAQPKKIVNKPLQIKPDAKEGHVRVCVRVRPMLRMERLRNEKDAWSCKDNMIFQTYCATDKTSIDSGLSAAAKAGPKPAMYTFDHIFTRERDNNFIFNKIGSDVVRACLSGYHGCVFAYGQTSSGKTHTIHGTSIDKGFIPLTVDEIFRHIETCRDREFVLRVSYLEIYNEIINDLLDPTKTNLRIREDRAKGVFCEGITEDVVTSREQIFSKLAAGESYRHTGRTNYNEISSRSHTVFRVVIESSEKELGKTTGGVRQSVCNLVDLAGSENAFKAGSDSRVKETGYINRSLHTLGHVILKLSENNPVSHIPYRDSKLTRILQNSLSGEAYVSVVCNISPSSGNLEETISTLKFASRAKKIKNAPQLNETFDQSTLLRQYRLEILRLREELAKLKPDVLVEASDDQENEADKTVEITAQIQHYQRLILNSGEAGTEDERGEERINPYRRSSLDPTKGFPSSAPNSPKEAKKERSEGPESQEIFSLKKELARMKQELVDKDEIVAKYADEVATVRRENHQFKKQIQLLQLQNLDRLETKRITPDINIKVKSPVEMDTPPTAQSLKFDHSPLMEDLDDPLSPTSPTGLIKHKELHTRLKSTTQDILINNFNRIGLHTTSPPPLISSSSISSVSFTTRGPTSTISPTTLSSSSSLPPTPTTTQQLSTFPITKTNIPSSSSMTYNNNNNNHNIEKQTHSIIYDDQRNGLLLGGSSMNNNHHILVNHHRSESRNGSRRSGSEYVDESEELEI